MEEEQNFSILDIINKLKITINYLLSKWLLILIFGLISGSLGLLISFIVKPKYQSHLTFVIENTESSSSSSILSLASSFGFGGAASSGLFTSENIIDILKSRKFIEKTLLREIPNKKQTFAQNYIDAYEMKEDWEDYPNLKKIEYKINEKREEFSIQKDSILNLIYLDLIEKRISITKPNEETSIIAIDIKHLDENFSKYFPEILLEESSSYYSYTKTKKSKSSVDILQRQTDSVRNELNIAITGVASSNDQVFGLNPSMNIARVPSAKKQVDVQANTAVLTELVKNLELTKMTLLNETPLIEIIDKPIFPLEIIEIKPIIAILIGGFLGGFLAILFLLIKNYFNTLKNESYTSNSI